MINFSGVFVIFSYLRSVVIELILLSEKPTFLASIRYGICTSLLQSTLAPSLQYLKNFWEPLRIPWKWAEHRSVDLYKVPVGGANMVYHISTGNKAYHNRFLHHPLFNSDFIFIKDPRLMSSLGWSQLNIDKLAVYISILDSHPELITNCISNCYLLSRAIHQAV